jgi:hypothetical protein
MDTDLASATLGKIAQSATWTGKGTATGLWRGQLRIDVAGDAEARCDAELSGIYDGTKIELTGACNANYAGATDVVLNAVRKSNGTLEGTITVSSRALPEEPRIIPWKSTNTDDDHLTGFASGVHSEAGFDFAYDAELRAVYVGTRPLISFDEFEKWIQSTALKHSSSAGMAVSLPHGEPECNITIPVIAGAE